LLTTPLHVLYLGLLAGAAMGVIYRAVGPAHEHCRRVRDGVAR